MGARARRFFGRSGAMEVGLMTGLIFVTVLAAIIVPSMMGVQQQADERTVLTEARQVETALQEMVSACRGEGVPVGQSGYFLAAGERYQLSEAGAQQLCARCELDSGQLLQTCAVGFDEGENLIYFCYFSPFRQQMVEWHRDEGLRVGV